MKLTRREFMVGCSAAIAAMAGGRIGNLVFAQDSAAAAQRDILVVVFLRGGCDSLNLIAPTSDVNYVAARSSLRVTEAEGLELKNPVQATAGFKFHPAAGGLKELYDGNALAIIHACGLTNGTRSHFDAMDYIERGTPDNKNTPTGWITRMLTRMAPEGLIPAFASGSSVPDSLLNSTYAIAVGQKVQDFALRNSPGRYAERQTQILKQLYQQGDLPLHQSGLATLEAIETVQNKLPRDSEGNVIDYEPEPDAEYTEGGLSDALRRIAQIIKLDIGLQVATVDFGGWDTHDSQDRVFPDRVEELSRSLNAFYDDLAAYHGRLTVVVMSEFGRRLKENRNGGTDHGHGGLLMLLGGNVQGGRMHGTWPGLANEQLDRGVDLTVATDFRTVLSEIAIRRMATPYLSEIFPGFENYQPLEVVTGTDLPIE